MREGLAPTCMAGPVIIVAPSNPSKTTERLSAGILGHSTKTIPSLEPSSRASHCPEAHFHEGDNLDSLMTYLALREQLEISATDLVSRAHLMSPEDRIRALQAMDKLANHIVHVAKDQSDGTEIVALVDALLLKVHAYAGIIEQCERVIRGNTSHARST